MSQKTKIISLMIFRIISIVIGLLLWFCGFIVFGGMDNKILGWILWGFFCIFSMPVELIKGLFKGAREGAIEGANTFTVRDYGSSITVSNSPNGGALKGMLIQTAALLLVGPFLLGCKIIANLLTVITCIITLCRIKANNNDD